MITIRDAQLSDASSIAQLHAASWRRTYKGIYSDAFLDQEVEQDRAAVWQQRLSAPVPNQHVLVAVQDNTIIGFACFFLDDDPVYGTLLDNLHIALPHQGSGIGKRLLQAGATRIQEKSQSLKLYLWVYETNTNARKVYERLGATHVETVDQPTAGGVSARACRYAWEDAKVLAGEGLFT